MAEPRIGFIGGGNMARSLIGGLLADGHPTDSLRVSDPSAEQRSALEQSFGLDASGDNGELVGWAEVVVLAVKPQMMAEVCREIAPVVAERKPLLVSVAAGVRTDALAQWLGGNPAVVRSMPNTPALVQSGATALFANPQVTAGQREMAEGVLRAVGLTLWVDDEDQMDAVTALSGSGPAYFFLVMEAMEAAGRGLGLPPDTARLLTLQTAFGAAKMALESEEDAASLRHRVTSPGGTTEKAIAVLEQRQLRAAFAEALDAARHRSEELARLLGGNT